MVRKLTHGEAEARRDLGIERVGTKADRLSRKWVRRASILIAAYAVKVKKPFLIEDVLPFAAKEGLEPPHDARAWGAATQRARRRHLIRSCGYAPARSSNLSPKVLWEANE